MRWSSFMINLSMHQALFEGENVRARAADFADDGRRSRPP